MIRPEFIPDPLFSAKQAVELYGDAITPLQVKCTLNALNGIHQNKNWYPGDLGPIVKRHYKRGWQESSDLAYHIILDAFLIEGSPFCYFLKTHSRQSAQYQVLYALQHLEEAMQAGIWGKQER